MSCDDFGKIFPIKTMSSSFINSSYIFDVFYHFHFNQFAKYEKGKFGARELINLDKFTMIPQL